METKSQLLLFLPLSMFFLFPGSFTLLETDGGWLTSRHAALAEDGSCTVERRDSSLTYAQFIQQYAFSRPVILQGLTDNTEFQAQCTKDQLLARFGEHLVRLSTANTYSYHKVDLPFQDYVDHLLEPQDLASLGSETLYFFGNNNFTEWGSLFKKYNPPPFRIPGTTGAYSFGIGGSGSGVPFHWHGPGFSEVIFGRKHWFLYPPEKTPEFHPNRTTLSWFLDTYPFLPPREKPVECTIHPGEAGCYRDVHKPEVLYFPDHWWHATLNLDTSVFISTFLEVLPDEDRYCFSCDSSSSSNSSGDIYTTR